MGAAEIVVTVVTAVACLGMGVFLGSLPFKRDELTEWHMKYQQLGGVLACGIVIVLMLLGYDLASWLAIAALAVGVAESHSGGSARLAGAFPRAASGRTAVAVAQGHVKEAPVIDWLTSAPPR